MRATLLDTLGKVYCDLGLINQAEPLLKEAYEIRLARPENAADLATSLLNVGVMARAKGQYAEAERLLRQACEIRIRLTNPDSLAVAEAEFALGWTQFERVRVEGLAGVQSAEIAANDKMMEHVLAIQRRELGANHRDVGITLVALALRHFMEQRLVESEKLLIQAGLVLGRQADGQSFLVGLMDFQRAALDRKNKKYEQAAVHYASSIEKLEKAVGARISSLSW